ncbi:hypothetical protein ACUN9W_17380, partial [Escherichia coli]
MKESNSRREFLSQSGKMVTAARANYDKTLLDQRL